MGLGAACKPVTSFECNKIWSGYGRELITDEEFLNTPALDGHMSRKEWIEAHSFLKPKRKNVCLPKAIIDIKKKKFEAYGVTDEKPEPIDHDALDAELEEQMMDRACEEMAEAKKKQGHVGKRLRQPSPQRRHSQVDSSKFWS